MVFSCDTSFSTHVGCNLEPDDLQLYSGEIPRHKPQTISCEICTFRTDCVYVRSQRSSTSILIVYSLERCADSVIVIHLQPSREPPWASRRPVIRARRTQAQTSSSDIKVFQPHKRQEMNSHLSSLCLFHTYENSPSAIPCDARLNPEQGTPLQ